MSLPVHYRANRFPARLLQSGLMIAALALAVSLAQSAAPSEFDRLVREAAAQMRRNQPDAAIQELTKAIALNPRSAAVHLLLGQAYLAKASPDYVAEAKAEFQQARDLDPAEPLASFYIAKIDLDLGRLAPAERELRAALERKPAEHYLLALLAETRRRQGQAKEAVTLATQAIGAGPDALPVHYYRALARRDLGDNAGALDDLRVVLETPFANAETWTAAGEIHLGAGRLTDAEVALRRAVSLDPKRAESRLPLARLFRRSKRYTEALAELDAVESAPQLSSPYYQKLLGGAAFERGLILAERGNEDGAEKAFRRAVEIDPANDEARVKLRQD
jgi:tetratricopeptide (TPR) repeat protein